MSASMGKGRSLRSAWSVAMRAWTILVVGAAAEDLASRSANSLFSLPKAAISVGQTKVKSLGQKKYTFHLPG